MQTTKRVTIRDVARAAGVSTQTVSRVLNERTDVSAQTRARILAIIAELGYSPNALARSLIQGHSRTLGVVAYGLSYYGPSRVLTGIEHRANALGYSVMLSLLHDPETNDGQELFFNLRSRQVDGIIWAVPEIGANRAWIGEHVDPMDCPVVFINMQPDQGASVAAIDNREGGRLATGHLLAQGYRRIGLISGPDSWWEARQREQGWREAMQAGGVAPGTLDAFKVAGDWYPSSGSNGLETLLRRHPYLEAVFACNDPMAAGALQAARRLGRRVPEDLAIVGFDDTPEAVYYYPSLTTIRQPLAELGARAVDMVIHTASGAAQPTPQALWMHPELVIRESSARR
ncbi:MAG TPA: LacI family DNA-binding transcriptional regulator [Anaerolineaceae bacterium]